MGKKKVTDRPLNRHITGRLDDIAWRRPSGTVCAVAVNPPPPPQIPPPNPPTVHHGPGVPVPPKKSRRWFLIALAAVLVCCGLPVLAAGVIDATGLSGGNPLTGRPAQFGTGDADPVDPQPAAPKPDFHTPAVADFKLTVKVLEKQCFGSAGCLITYRVELIYDATNGHLDPSVTYEVTYEMRGGEDPKINTLRVTGTEYRGDERETIRTPSSKAEVTAVVTSVSR